MIEVEYRLCDIASTNPSPWSHEDKVKLNRTCLRSFIKSFWRVDYKMNIICDHADISKYTDLLDDVVYDVVETSLGINETMKMAYDLARDADDIVIFQECDYLFRPDSGQLWIDAIEKLDLVSPYDHRNFYMDRSIHSSTCEIDLVNDHHFRTTERNTMTWGTKSHIVRENIDMLMYHGYLDVDVWRDFLFSGHKLWVPIPSIATHCVENYLAPGVSWEKVWQENQ